MDPTRILPEILLDVFSYLPFRDTVSVSQVSHAWRFLSQKQLYSEPLLTEASSASLFLRTLLTPGLESLAVHVRDLTVTGENTLPLLHMLPRLDGLTLYIPDEPDTLNDFLRGTHEPENLPLAFRSISRFSCVWPPRQSDHVPQKLLTMFGLPRVHTLKFFTLYEMEFSFPTSQHKTSAVTTLQFVNSVIPCSSLDHILHLPRALTRLYFIGTITYSDINRTGFQVALEPLRMTLQELEFIIDDDPSSPDVSGPPPPISFRSWPVLRRLRCQIRILLGWSWGKELHFLEDVLPPCIRDFGVITENDWYFNEVARMATHLVRRKQMVMPMLERFVCFTGWMDVEMAQKLQVACDDAGVVLTNNW